jgi:hypothetical protein
MKITTSQLRKIIRTEYQKILLEQDDPWNDPITPEELETDKIAQELENAWKAYNRGGESDTQHWLASAGTKGGERHLADVDSEILDLAIAVSSGKMTMEDALMGVKEL